MNFYKSLNLKDLPGERWVDMFGYEGEYLVSNLGRVKSLERTIQTKQGPRKIYMRILKQSPHYKGTDKHINRLVISIRRKTLEVGRLVYLSFNKNVTFKENEWIIHANKVSTNNTLVNLVKGPRSLSRKLDMLLSERTIKSIGTNFKPMVDARKKYLKNRTHKVCSVCGRKDKINVFKKGRSMHDDCLKLRQRVWSRKKRLKTKNNKEIKVKIVTTKKDLVK